MPSAKPRKVSAPPETALKLSPVAARQGPWLWDQEGRRYIDTALGFGATILGHGPASVVHATTEAIRAGPMPAFAHAGEEAAAAALARATAPLSSVVFTSTGSEAVHLASRIARVATGRELIIKMAAGYDGWYDDVTLGQAGSREALMRRTLDRGASALCSYDTMTSTTSSACSRKRTTSPLCC